MPTTSDSGFEILSASGRLDRAARQRLTRIIEENEAEIERLAGLVAIGGPAVFAELGTERRWLGVALDLVA